MEAGDGTHDRGADRNVCGRGVAGRNGMRWRDAHEFVEFVEPVGFAGCGR
jgi:hypothetical protein